MSELDLDDLERIKELTDYQMKFYDPNDKSYGAASRQGLRALHAALTQPSERNAVVEAARRLIQSAKMLHTNAAGCAADHYGHDFKEHGPPKWLDDCLTDIRDAETALRQLQEQGDG